MLTLGAVLISMLAGAPSKPKPKAVEPVLVFRSWHPGLFPGDWGRTTLTLTPAADGTATLELSTAAPPHEQRRDFNPKDWVVNEERAARHTGTFKDRRGGGRTFWFEVKPGEQVALACTQTSEALHAAEATVAWADGCTPCYDPCKGRALWKPARTETKRGWSCRLLAADQVDDSGAPRRTAKDDTPTPEVPGLRSVPERPMFFLPAPGAELLSGHGDCPPEGLRFAR